MAVPSTLGFPREEITASQIYTCRPNQYLLASAWSHGGAVFVRLRDLRRIKGGMSMSASMVVDNIAGHVVVHQSDALPDWLTAIGIIKYFVDTYESNPPSNTSDHGSTTDHEQRLA